MPEIVLELLHSGKKWTFTKAEIRIGRNQNCDVAISGEEFPMVGREHALIRREGSGFWVEDSGSMNGTLVNGHRLSQNRQLTTGDIIRLGSDGPEIRAILVVVHGVDSKNVSEAPTIPSKLAPTIASVKASSHSGEAPTIPSQLSSKSESPHFPKVAADGSVQAGALAPTIPSQVASKAHSSVPPGSDPFAPTVRNTAGSKQSAQSESADLSLSELLSPEEEEMLESKINLLRNLVIGMFVLLLVMGGVILSEMQKIDENRTAIVNLGLNINKQANDAVSKFQPQLDERLKKLDSNLASVQDQMNGMDDKIRQSEDRFVQRMDKELPKIMDQYINKKMAEMKKDLPH